MAVLDGAPFMAVFTIGIIGIITIPPTLVVSQSTAVAGPACKLTLSNAVPANSCVSYDLCPAGTSPSAPAAGFELNDSYLLRKNYL
eukprot:COSAG02_NODE_789_length_17189_cov_23.034114_16_plen_86_part_00